MIRFFVPSRWFLCLDKWQWWLDETRSKKKLLTKKLLSNEYGNSLNYNKYSVWHPNQMHCEFHYIFFCPFSYSFSERKSIWLTFWCRSRNGVIVGALPKWQKNHTHTQNTSIISFHSIYVLDGNSFTFFCLSCYQLDLTSTGFVFVLPIFSCSPIHLNRKSFY